MATVAVLDTTYPDLDIEELVFRDHDINLIRQDGSDRRSVNAVSGADVIIVGSRARFDADAIEALSGRAIIRAGIGVDNVDLTAAEACGVAVCNVPDYGTEAVAQHALAMALAGTRRLIEADNMVRRRQWGFRQTRPMHLPSSLAAGVVGLGRIGARTAELFAAVGFGSVAGHDPHISEPPITTTDIGSLFASCDVISIHVPGNLDGTPVIDAELLGLMRVGSVLVNTARGTVIDTVALAAALAEGRPRIAALDVFAEEPPDLAEFEGVTDRLILSPHQAWYSEESQADLRLKSAEEALRIINGDPPLHPIRPTAPQPGQQEVPT